jgi:hypothetical protein
LEEKGKGFVENDKPRAGKKRPNPAIFKRKLKMRGKNIGVFSSSAKKKVFSCIKLLYEKTI